MGTSNHIIFIRDWLEFAIATVSLVCSLLTLLLIKKLNTWNGNLLLITTLTLFQVCYDINFMFSISPGLPTCIFWHFLDVFGGLGVSFTTNVISYTVCYVVSEIASVNVIENYKYFAIYMILLPLAIAIVATFSLTDANIDDNKPFTECVYDNTLKAIFVENFYYWGRLISIIFNIMAFLYINYRIRNLGFVLKNNMTPASSNQLTLDDGMTMYEKKVLAVKALAGRMKYYPIAQSIIRAGSAWNEFDNYQYSNATSAIMSAVCASSSGIIYFLVFLIMQPNAWEAFISLFPDWMCFCHRFFEGRIDSTNTTNLQNRTTQNTRGPIRTNSNSTYQTRFDAFEDSALEEILTSDFLSMSASIAPSISGPSDPSFDPNDTLSITVNPVFSSDHSSKTYRDIMRDTT